MNIVSCLTLLQFLCFRFESKFISLPACPVGRFPGVFIPELDEGYFDRLSGNLR